VAAPFTLLELEQLWVAAGGAVSADATAAAVAEAESGGDPSVIDNTAYPNRPNYHPPSAGAQPEYSVGLWQINMLAHPQYTEAELLTPTGNTKAAITISKDGADWTPWSTYTSGKYQQYLASAETQAGGGTGGGSGTTVGQATQALGGWAHLQQAVNGAMPFAAVHGRTILNDARKALSDAAKVTH
jgi:lysozyme-like protein